MHAPSLRAGVCLIQISLNLGRKFLPAPGIQLRILEEPLTADNLSAILSTFTDLYTKCWLIQQVRFADLMDYTQTHQPRYAQEANLRVTRLSYSSPALILFSGVGQAVGEALKKTLEAVLQAPKEMIDAVAQAPERKEAKKLENEATSQALEQQEREADLRERKREIELREQQAEAHLRMAEVRLKTFDLTVEHALHLVEMLQPEADPRPK